MDNEEFEAWKKLVNDIEARKERDASENAAWKNGEMDRIKAEEEATEFRLGVRNAGVTRETQQKREEIEKQYQERRKASEKRHAELEQELSDGKLHHVWVVAEEEERFKEAKQRWDFNVKEKLESYGKALTEKEIGQFEKEYGSQIVRQLKLSTAREFKQEEDEKRQRQADREERARLYEAEQAQKREKQRIDEKVHEAHKNGLAMTFDTDPTPEKMKNPVDKASIQYDWLIEQYKNKNGIRH